MSTTLDKPYDELISFENLLKAYFVNLKGKRSKPRYAEFHLDFAYNLYKLFLSLKSRTFAPDLPVIFRIYCNSGQKTREVHASTVRNSIVQRLLYDYLNELFDPSFIYDSYGCRLKKGTMKAADRCQEYIRQSPEGSYYLQLDVKKFYYNIDHAILRQELSKNVHDREVLDLCMAFTCHTPNEYSYVPFAENVGLDVGAMISQLYGLIYLNRLDHYAKRTLGIKRYVRYVDDIVIIGETKEQCLEYQAKLTQYLWETLRLKLSSSFIHPLSQGINFAGFRMWREYRLVRKFSIRNFWRELKKPSINPASIQATLAHACHSASYKYMCDCLLDTHPELLPKLKGQTHRDLYRRQAEREREERNQDLAINLVS